MREYGPTTYIHDLEKLQTLEINLNPNLLSQKLPNLPLFRNDFEYNKGSNTQRISLQLENLQFENIVLNFSKCSTLYDFTLNLKNVIIIKDLELNFKYASKFGLAGWISMTDTVIGQNFNMNFSGSSITDNFLTGLMESLNQNNKIHGNIKLDVTNCQSLVNPIIICLNQTVKEIRLDFSMCYRLSAPVFYFENLVNLTGLSISLQSTKMLKNPKISIGNVPLKQLTVLAECSTCTNFTLNMQNYPKLELFDCCFNNNIGENILDLAVQQNYEIENLKITFKNLKTDTATLYRALSRIINTVSIEDITIVLEGCPNIKKPEFDFLQSQKLRKLHLHMLGAKEFESFNFRNTGLESLHISLDDLSYSDQLFSRLISDIDTQFPNLRELQLDLKWLGMLKTQRFHFPNLKFLNTLTINNSHQSNLEKVQIEAPSSELKHLSISYKLCTQIKSFHIDFKIYEGLETFTFENFYTAAPEEQIMDIISDLNYASPASLKSLSLILGKVNSDLITMNLGNLNSLLIFYSEITKCANLQAAIINFADRKSVV